MSADITSPENALAIPQGYKQTEVGVIPEDWKLVNSSDLINYIAGFGFSSRLATNNGIKWLKIANVGLNEIKWDASSYLPESLVNHFQDYLLQNGDVVMALTRPLLNDKLKVARLYEKDLPALLNQRVAKLSPKGKNSLSYIYYVTQRADFIAEMNLAMAGSDPPNIGTTTLSHIRVLQPSSIKEQTAIGNALSDVDALLCELEKLIAKKQAIKTATMQQLLTGKTRLPAFAVHSEPVNKGSLHDGLVHTASPYEKTNHTENALKGQRKGTKPSELGEIPEDWEVVSLASLLTESPKYGINAAAVPLIGSLPVYIRITDISEDGYFKPTEKVGVNNPLSEMYKLQIGDLVLARTGASVGKSYLYRENDGELIFAGFLIKVSPNVKKLSSEYLAHYFKTDRYWSWVTVNSMRSGQPGINGNEFGRLQLPIPKIKEQTAIAKILSDMDSEIQALTQRLAKTRQIKQGMMQALLTGKIRLPFEKTQVNGVEK